MHGKVLLVALALGIIGCGDHLVARDFEGEPVYTHPHFGVALGFLPPEIENPRHAIFWIVEGVAGSGDDAVEQLGTSRPARDETRVLHLFASPGPDLMATTADGVTYGIAFVRLYDDRDGDGQRGPDEDVFGNSGNGLLYFPEAVTAETSPIGRPFAAGYHPIDFPLPCAVYGLDMPECEASPDIGSGCRCRASARAGSACRGCSAGPAGTASGSAPPVARRARCRGRTRDPTAAKTCAG